MKIRKQAGSTPFWRAKIAPFQGTFYLSWTVKYALGSLAENEGKRQCLY
ncbi:MULTISPECIES: hypothetical protein [Arenibacter]|nr:MULTISPECIES: hypothetical protein [Arenibacter]MDX1766474.1 hypothetical protein [Arenibacter troitsensis]